jgi:hypothetical protein
MNLRFLVHIVIMVFLGAGCADVCHAGDNQFSGPGANPFVNEFNANQEFNANREFNTKHKFKRVDELRNRRFHRRWIFLKFLFGREPTLPTTPPDNEGNMYLLPSDQVGKPLPDLATLPCWANDNVQGIAFRTQWSRVEPSEHNYFWDVLDQCASLAEANGKTFSILVTAGVTTPQWVFDAGATRFDVTEQNGSPPSPMPVPWDRVFQSKWSSFVSALATRYGNNPNLIYVVMGGFGRRAESFFVTTEEDQAAMDALAQKDGFTDGLAAWLKGTKWVITKYARTFEKVPVILDMGAPYPTDAGNATLQEACDFGALHAAGHFAVKSDGLAPGGPPMKSMGVTEVSLLSPTSLVGYQMTLPQDYPPDLQTSLNRGIGFGAHFIEIYSADCDDPATAPVLQSAAFQWGIATN